MRSATRSAQRVRLASILALGAFALHQLRYLIAFGGSSSEELARQGHGYLADASPVLGVLALSAVLATLIRGGLGAGLVRTPLWRRASIFAGALLSIYLAQESLEGLLAAGHPAGLACVVAEGGWLAIPLVLVLGGLAALVAGALEGVEVAIAVRRRSEPRRPRAVIRPRGTRACSTPRLTPLAFGLARRPPPSAPA
jgi:hypothetical protein